MAKRRTSSDQVKRLFLAGLGVVFAAVFVYRLFLSGPPTKPRGTPQQGTATAVAPVPANATGSGGSKARSMGAAAQQEALMQALLSDTTPLNLRLASSGASSTPGARGNIFAYFVPPKEPPPKPPDPPPVQLVSMQPQSAVAGTPRALTLTVSGNRIPADAQIFIDARPRPTKRLSETQLSTEISPGDYSSARSMNVELKSPSNPALFSNAIQFVVQQAPEPQFVFKGRLGTLGQPQSNYAVVELNATKEIKRVKVGDTIMGIWRVDAVSADGIDVTLTQYDIKRRVQLQDKVR